MSFLAVRYRKVRVFGTLVLLGLLLVASAACGGAGGGQAGSGAGEVNPDDTSPVQMTLAGASAQGFFRTLGETIGSIVREQYPGSSIEYEPGSPAGSTAKVISGQAQLAAPATTIEYRLAREGAEPFEQPAEEGRMLGVMRFYNEAVRFDSIMNQSFAEEYGITSMQDIADKKPPLRVVINQQGNTQGVVPARAIFEAYGFSFEDIESWGGQIFYESSGPGVELLADRRVDMYFNGTLIPNSDLAEVARSVDLTWVEMDEGKLQQVGKEWGLPLATTPAGTYEFLAEDQPTLSIPHEMISNPDVPAQDVYKLVKAVYENQEQMSSVHPGMAEFSSEVMVQVRESGIPLHPGAEQFYREEGLIE